ncbi:M15 family metallopeptidase [Alisedimentitalea sp. MJ-SS2]|uniref:M15 family metallopeptidase n=1 Tax=Aliisedimentitalea sp. MJ-SS2 TaxID=3049795 RepID=UPI0029087FF4|nr:M15 family metallopeptidase [Alisedimentitalea sp. MJ-SS2]MDU8927260.1 M15 family metallopeptidase [Alisedimentitalea sp. MJ-SS2]
MLIRHFLFGSLLLAPLVSGSAHAESPTCTPVNFAEIQLAAVHQNASVASILIAYPDVTYSDTTRTFTFENGASIPFRTATDRPPPDILKAPTVGDQFRYLYPLEFDLSQRRTPWNDPGRVRNEGFMRALYFGSKSEARKTLTRVTSSGDRASFNVTRKRGVACQLQAVLTDIGTTDPQVFQNAGGSFNWRKISGTDRLSVHSYGAAVDLNTKLGGYWKWQGAPVGKVGTYDNKIPQAVVEAFERYGFIWGGKWHHYDGMHFEYRPELIIYSRMKTE